MKKKEKSKAEIWRDDTKILWKAIIHKILSLDPNSEKDKKIILKMGKLYIRSLERPLNIAKKFCYKNKKKLNNKNHAEVKKTLLIINNELKKYSKMKKYDYKNWIKWANENKKFIE